MGIGDKCIKENCIGIYEYDPDRSTGVGFAYVVVIKCNKCNNRQVQKNEKET